MICAQICAQKRYIGIVKVPVLCYNIPYGFCYGCRSRNRSGVHAIYRIGSVKLQSEMPPFTAAKR